jgi:hypothetical protein
MTIDGVLLLCLLLTPGPSLIAGMRWTLGKYLSNKLMKCVLLPKIMKIGEVLLSNWLNNYLFTCQWQYLRL